MDDPSVTLALVAHERSMPTPAVGPGFENPARWYKKHYALVWDTARRYGIPIEAREDVVQETFLAAYRRRSAVGSVSMRAWLYGIARRVAANHRRRAFRDRRKRDQLAEEHVVPDALTSDKVIAISTIEAFLATLNPVQRELFVLSEIEGFTGPEIARALGRNLATTYSQIRTTRLRFVETCDASSALVKTHRRERPRAGAASWALLMPKLNATTTLSWPWWSPKIVGLLIGMAASGVVVATTVALVPAAPAISPGPHAKQTELGNTGDVASQQNAAIRLETAVASPEVPLQAAAFVTSVVQDHPKTDAVDAAPRARSKRRVVPVVAPASSRTAAATPKPETASAVAMTTESAVLLREAMLALRHDKHAHALELVDRHESRFPGSAFADVRIVIRVTALCGLGKRSQARPLAEHFLQTHPSSPMSKRLRQACPEKK